MDTLENYRDIIKRVLAAYAQLPYSYGNLERRLVIDSHTDNYLLMTVGWENHKRIHFCLIHLEIIGDKIWIQRDGTEDGITYELLKEGIPKDKIVLAFHPLEVRQYTGYAIQ